MTSEAGKHRAEAAQMSDGDVVAIILRHHADITDSMQRLAAARGGNRRTDWTALIAFLKAHETAEQKVVRPAVESGASSNEAGDRNAEEQEADHAIAELDAVGPDSPQFGAMFADFAKKVHDHAEAEEKHELPILRGLPEDRRVQLGTDFMAAFQAAG